MKKTLKQRIITKTLSLPIKQIFLYGILIRLLLMPITGHWDLTSLNDIASYIISHGVTYKDYYYYSISIYPPLTYYFLAGWQMVIKPLVGADFYGWLREPILNAFFNPHVFRYFFLLKIPHLLFDVGIGLLLVKFFTGEENKKKMAAIVWAFNPVVLYATFSWGAIDIIPTFFLLASIVLIKFNKRWLGIPLIGIGAAFKLFPIIFLLPIVLVAFKTFKHRVMAFLLGVLPFILIIAPFLTNPGFQSNVLQSDRGLMIYAAYLYIGFLKFIYFFFIFYTVAAFWLMYTKSVQPAKLWKYILAIFLFFYGTVAFTPQWFVWGIPFFIIQLVNQPRMRIFFTWVFIGYLLTILAFDAPLSIGLFSPVEPSLWVMPVAKEIIERFTQDSNKIWSIFHSFLAGALIWYAYQWSQGEKQKNG